MTLLRDLDIVQLIDHVNPIVVDLPRPPIRLSPAGSPAGTSPPNPWFGPASSIQPSSLDLHVGDIMVPGTEEDKAGSVAHPKERIALNTGDTVVVCSREELRLPKNIAAIGFPPAHLSFQGLVMTNPGHVDPGFVGRLRFAVMNIGKEAIILEQADAIVTLLLFRLEGAVAEGWAERNGKAEAGKPTDIEVDRLSNDYLDISNRADAAASRAVDKADLSTKRRALWLPLVTALVSALGVALIAVVQPYNRLEKDLDKLKTDLETTTKVLAIKEAKSRLDELRKQNDDLVDTQKNLILRLDDLTRKLETKATGAKR